VTLYIEGFSRLVTSTTAPIATGWSDSCRVGYPPLGDRAFPRRTETDVLERLSHCAGGRHPKELDLFAPILDLEFKLPAFEAHYHPPEPLPGNLLAVDHEHGESAVLFLVSGNAPANQGIGDMQSRHLALGLL